MEYRISKHNSYPLGVLLEGNTHTRLEFGHQSPWQTTHIPHLQLTDMENLVGLSDFVRFEPDMPASEKHKTVLSHQLHLAY